MEDEFFNVPLQDVKREIRHGIVECQKRGLLQSAKWLSEMNFGLNEVEIDLPSTNGNNSKYRFCETSAWMDGIDVAEYDNYFMAKSCFDVREYDRAAYFVRNCESPVPRFLHLYATYMAKEKRKLDSTTEESNLNDSGHVRDLADLLSTLRAEHSKSKLDGYGFYLYGVVLKALNLNEAAIQMFTHSIRLSPMLWGSYVELAPLITDKEKLHSMTFGGHWMRKFFVGHTYLELFLNDEGVKTFEELQAAGFSKCVYITSQMALAYHNKRDVDKAIELFQAIQETEPYRLDNLDTYSNLLFVKELKTEMAQLAHKAVNINKYRPETCCVVGNYYSIRSDHQMSISYFQRALKLNPNYLAAWTLMGHEFMELKNTNAAIQSYRKAVEVNKRDYRAWYGLGQSYEILKMHYYSLYYFKMAHQLRPYDSRMLVALGETYEKLNKCENAIKCYCKACDVGDIEGIAMYRMANLYEKLEQYDNAVQCYVMYCADERSGEKSWLYHGYITLANYYEGKAEYDKAWHYAFKCLESDERKSEAKALLRTIDNKRNAQKRSGAGAADLEGTSSGETNRPLNILDHALVDTDVDTDEDEIDMEIEMDNYKYLRQKSSRSAAAAPVLILPNTNTPRKFDNYMSLSESRYSPSDAIISSTMASTSAAVASTSMDSVADNSCRLSVTSNISKTASTSTATTTTVPANNPNTTKDAAAADDETSDNDMDISTIDID